MIANKIIIFAKAPVPGQVKTRFCPSLTSREAARLYISFVKDTIDFARRVPGTDVEIAYAAAAPYPDLGWLEDQASLPFFLQYGLDLGNRLTNAFERAFRSEAGKVVIIGSDTPHLDPRVISEAFSLLGSWDVALGPARDGGYYLVGLKSPNPPLFNGISWSTSRVFAQTLERVKNQKLSFGLLPSYGDIDTVADLEILEKLSQNGRAHRLRFSARALKSIKTNPQFK